MFLKNKILPSISSLIPQTIGLDDEAPPIICWENPIVG